MKSSVSITGAETDGNLLNSRISPPSSKGLAYTLYMRDIAAEEPLESDEESKLLQLAQIGDQSAEEKLVKTNLKLIVKIASQYAHTGMAHMDLISEGNIGLLKAIRTFDENRGTGSFKTHIHYCVKQSIVRALQTKARLISRTLNQCLTQLKQRLHNAGVHNS